MIGTRPLLLVAAGAAIAGFAGSIAIEDAVGRGALSPSWHGLLGALLGCGAIAAVVVSFIHAQRQQRNGFGWAVGALLFPYAAPLVLAALPAAGGAVVSDAEQSAGLKAVLAGKWICPCGQVRDDGREGELCATCGKPLLRFVAAEPDQRCSGCGFLFSDGAARLDEQMVDVWSRKGFRCSSCGGSVCLSCIPKDRDGEATFHCPCGGGLAIRL